ncbi:hypothetical protein SRABI36_02116 [Pedobacter sp. Bi36]|nr:hypothetical protein SRABI126_00564 [Pedobacter sp. Bi126]CAH0206139.1 hypothetical protein SRABI36_02116 [Pedobacter sp. Bi36]
MNLYNLTYSEILDALNKMDAVCEIVVEKEAFIPEANLILCRFKGERFNLKYDLNYGPDIEAIGNINKSDLEIILQLILQHHHSANNNTIK